jgi:diguanylate cyclase (GGDEF)-like protein
MSKHPHRRRLGWIAFGATVVALVGMAGSAISARAIATHQAERARQTFVASSREIASTLELAIQRENDLILSGAAFVFTGGPNVSKPAFVRWATSMHMLQRYPELQQTGAVVIVPASHLAAFETSAVANHVAHLSPDGSFPITPPGRRPFYCIALVGMGRGTPVAPAGALDVCAGPVRAALLGARDSGEGSYLPVTLGTTSALAVQLPIYRGGAVPTTVRGRRHAFMGWFGTFLVPDVLMHEALRGHPQTSLTFRYEEGLSRAAFQSGTAPTHAQSVSIDLHNGWTVTTSTVAAGGGVFANGDALALLLAGVAGSLLFGALIFVLGTGRARAMWLVGERTGDLRHQALHDALTGLPNRVLIMDRIEQLLARSRRNGTTCAALYVDIDEFKNVNDTLGHEAGDRLLVAVAARLSSALRDTDSIGRMGGDEFIVLIDGAGDDVGPETVAQRLLTVMQKPFQLEGASMPSTVTISIGIATGERSNPGDLLRDADVALYQAKAAGKNCSEIFFPAMQAEISHRIELEFDLRSALEGEQFRLVYQPIYRLDDLSIVGAEALLRWDRPVHGLARPDEFIPVLERTGRIREVGRWVLQAACLQMALWHDRGDTQDVSVNVSGRQLDDDTIVDDIRDALSVSGLPATSLIIEVTETALMRNADATARRLQAIKELGVRIAVDDFGTGYSSLAYLRRFPVDCLKIDRTFTNAVTVSPESKDLIRTFVQLGRDLGLRTLAEGVETTDELDHLRSENVDEAQGFLLSHPLDPQTLEDQLLAPLRPVAPAAWRA